MPLFRRYRRFWCLFAAGLLFIPLIGHLFTKPEEQSLAEVRMLASRPLMPNNLLGIIELPKKMDAFLNDHYGLRSQIMLAYGLIHYALSSPTNSRVFYGKDNWLFFTGERTLQQITHDQPRLTELRQFADFLSSINILLQREGRTFVVAIPPNKESVYSDKLPPWLQRLQNKTGPTEYDILLSELERHKITTVDLRQILREAAAKNLVYYPTDTHWNFLGAILSYNALVIAAGKENWIINVADATTPSKKTHNGDLARLLGLANYLEEETYQIAPVKLRKQTVLNDGIYKKYFHKSYIIEQRDAESTVLILGDSFSNSYFKPLFARYVSRLIWTHHRKCGFDWSFVTRYQPDVVFYLPLERGIGCAPRTRPKGLDVQLFENSSVSILKINGFGDAKKLKPIDQLTIANQAGVDDTIILNSIGRDPRMLLPTFNTTLAKKYIIKIALESPIETNLELYYMTQLQKGFKNNQKVSQKLTPGKNTVYLNFPLDSEVLYGPVRLDIGSEPGTYLIKSIEVRATN